MKCFLFCCRIILRPSVIGLILIHISTNSFSQGFGDYLEKNAIEIDNPRKLNLMVYDGIKDFQLIMVGEMHGTKEPAELVYGLSNLLLEQGNSVSIGLEIPENELLSYIQNPTDSILRLTRFFSKENTDGRNGKSWFDLIKYCSSDTRINLFFFDNFKKYQIPNRDSAMYTTIIKQFKKFPKSKIITLSGNIHNWLIPFRGANTMGSYCYNDTVNFTQSKVCSINHVYAEGTMLNNTGEGLELKNIDFNKSVYSESVNFKNYLLFYKPSQPYQYNGFLYTEQVNHSDLIEE